MGITEKLLSLAKAILCKHVGELLGQTGFLQKVVLAAAESIQLDSFFRVTHKHGQRADVLGRVHLRYRVHEVRSLRLIRRVD